MNELRQSVITLGEILFAHRVFLATAESCTGGGIAQQVTSIVGSSQWFVGGVVSYSNRLKSILLGVEPETLQVQGAVSQAVVTQMAQGALVNLGAGFAIATTGIAGPTGGSVAKPVGTVWFGFAADGHPTETEYCVFGGDRADVREQAIAYALRRGLHWAQTFLL